ncbi:glycerol-3-phosphate 1-O-acyltransferase PlsB [Psychromonas ossibalaenae]|uniref:glycerol-3-phosphate 1-O-acyltransferase PlsB n=1 Tax=Psychromonas ossibalaenae TaxID=444922 RepID=UPI0003667E40|nr:glycerol-3-phosphate 1-O-acyltransferase PlsB [Psychromonas ossibalaenae]
MLAKGSAFSHFINRYWVCSAYVPLHPISELQLDLHRPIIYVVEQNSASDLLGLQTACLQAGLPDPFLPIEAAGQSLNAIIFIHNWSWFSPRLPQLQETPYLAQYQQLLNLHKRNSELDIQLLPVSFYWGRNPGKKGKTAKFDLSEQRQIGILHKSLVVLKNGKDHLVRFNRPISIASLCEREKNQTGGDSHFDSQLAHKLAKIAMTYFSQQKRTSIGPKLPGRKEMVETVLQQPALRKVIQQTAEQRQSSESQIEQQCREYLQEISADFSYPFLRVFRCVLGWVWNYIYQGIEVNHAQAVRQACQSGAEIIYMPCHRSHMDYLLLSYLLFEQGLVPPHVAAGVNLNFFPAGGVFRRSGAFFLRRTFKDSPLYAEVFKAYFAMLFKQGYPIEFFSEGGRSRTGRLLPPKTGLLAMSLQTYINQPERNVLIIPVYIGYDHIMEVSTYTKELTGQKKEKESIWQVLGIVKKLGNFGRAFVNFGEPVNIKQHFDQQIPNWRDMGIDQQQFKEQVDQVAQKVMAGINQAASVNALPLCASILLTCNNYQVEKPQLFEYINKHLQLLTLNNSGSLVTYKQQSAADVYQQALIMNKFEQCGTSVLCSLPQAAELTYYRNNIVHLFALPSLLCNTVCYLRRQNKLLTAAEIVFYASKVYPFVQAEYFLNEPQDIKALLEQGLDELQSLAVLTKHQEIYIVADDALLSVFVGHMQESYCRYYHFLLLVSSNNSAWQDVDFEETALQTKADLQNHSIEPFDMKVIKVYRDTLQRLYPDFIKTDQAQTLLVLFEHSL